MSHIVQVAVDHSPFISPHYLAGEKLEETDPIGQPSSLRVSSGNARGDKIVDNVLRKEGGWGGIVGAIHGKLKPGEGQISEMNPSPQAQKADSPTSTLTKPLAFINGNTRPTNPLSSGVQTPPPAPTRMTSRTPLRIAWTISFKSLSITLHPPPHTVLLERR